MIWTWIFVYLTMASNICGHRYSCKNNHSKFFLQKMNVLKWIMVNFFKISNIFLSVLKYYNVDYWGWNSQNSCQNSKQGRPWSDCFFRRTLVWVCTCLFDLILYIAVNNFSTMSGRVFLGWTSYKQGLMCLAQGHNTVTPVMLEPAPPQPRVKHSTTEPLCSLGSALLFVRHLMLGILITIVYMFHAVSLLSLVSMIWTCKFNLFLFVLKENECTSRKHTYF